MSAAATTTTGGRVWLITGCSSGFGRAIARAALAHGDRVIATSRDVEKIEDLKSHGAVSLALDVRQADETVRERVGAAVREYGRIDVLVNCAGYILTGAVEECSAEEIQAQFDTNVFGLLKLVRAVLPYMRARKSGIIATMGSLGGWRGHPVAGIYCASKHAVAALTEALKNEVAHLGIDVVTIEPGYFRTAFLTGGHRVTAFRQIDDLIPITSKWTAVFDAVVGKQPGDPAKGAQVIVEALTGSGRCEGRELPARLALGSDAVPAMTEILRTRQVDLDRWADVVTCTDCDDDGT